MNKLDRRQFLRTSIAATASCTLLRAAPCLKAAQTSDSSAVLGANGDIRYAVIGLNGRGKDHLDAMRQVRGTRLVALCDVDSAVLEPALQKGRDSGLRVQGYGDPRKLMESKDVDAVFIATPNHWHSLCAIWAIQAGKDVYVEKPVSHNVWEGRQLVEAARRHQRIVQAGTQSRSSSDLAEAIQWIREGHMGKILRARGFCYKRRASIGKTAGPQPIPLSVDYDLWCGPAPKEPLRRKHLHYDWHWVWPTGNGDIGNQGIHEMDLARWVLGETEVSPRVWSVGGRLGYEDDGRTPNTLITFHDYPAAPLIFEVRGLPTRAGVETLDNYRGVKIGIEVDFEAGSMVVGNEYAEQDTNFFDTAGQPIKRFKSASNNYEIGHFENFIAAVRSRRRADLKADILEGHISSALCHTGNISYLLGRPQQPEEIREAVKAKPDLAEAVGRMEQHLAANQIDLLKSPATLGEVLNMDPKAERFLDHPAANQLLTREYRAPFVVAEKV
jgi:predicted dehydrogenase